MREDIKIPVRITFGGPIGLKVSNTANIAVMAVYGRKNGKFLFAETGIFLDGEPLNDRPKPACL